MASAYHVFAIGLFYAVAVTCRVAKIIIPSLNVIGGLNKVLFWTFLAINFYRPVPGFYSATA